MQQAAAQALADLHRQLARMKIDYESVRNRSTVSADVRNSLYTRIVMTEAEIARLTERQRRSKTKNVAA